MNFGQRGRDLLLELKRSDWLPPYNEEGVRGTIEEISLHYKEVKDMAQTTETIAAAAAASLTSKRTADPKQPHQIPLQVKPAFLLHEASIQRNKRCLLAYHMYRLEKIQQLRWDSCTSSILSPQHRSILSEAEIEFYSQYDELVSSYCTNRNMDAVFSSSSATPPSEDDYFVEVRVATSGIGRITTEDGKSVFLDAGTTHHLRRSDVEHLIRQGVLHQLHVEEN